MMRAALLIAVLQAAGMAVTAAQSACPYGFRPDAAPNTCVRLREVNTTRGLPLRGLTWAFGPNKTVDVISPLGCDGAGKVVAVRYLALKTMNVTAFVDEPDFDGDGFALNIYENTKAIDCIFSDYDAEVAREFTMRAGRMYSVVLSGLLGITGSVSSGSAKIGMATRV